jgi:hypothetical protein
MLLCAGVGKRRGVGAAEVEIRARPTFRAWGIAISQGNAAMIE